MMYDWTRMRLMKLISRLTFIKHFSRFPFAALALAVTLWPFWIDVRHLYLSGYLLGILSLGHYRIFATYLCGRNFVCCDMLQKPRGCTTVCCTSGKR